MRKVGHKMNNDGGNHVHDYDDDDDDECVVCTVNAPKAYLIIKK